jgi:hypothetical protein
MAVYVPNDHQGALRMKIHHMLTARSYCGHSQRRISCRCQAESSYPNAPMTLPCGKYSQTWNAALPNLAGKILPGAHETCAQPTCFVAFQTTWVKCDGCGSDFWNWPASCSVPPPTLQERDYDTHSTPCSMSRPRKPATRLCPQPGSRRKDREYRPSA